MGALTEPQTTQVDPNPDFLKGLQSDLIGALGAEAQSPGSTFGGLTSPLQQQATGGIAQFLGQPAPEQQVFQQTQDSLLGLVSGAGAPQVGDLGGFEQSQALVQAAQPAFERNLHTALGSLANAAPGRFSTTFEQQGIDLGARALSDFNQFQQQALQQGLGLDLRNRGLGLQAAQIGQQGALGAAGALGNLAGQAGQAPFNRLSTAGQLGLQQQQAMVNPSLRLLLGGMQFGQPQALDTAVGESPLTQLGNLGVGAAGIARLFGLGG